MPDIHLFTAAFATLLSNPRDAALIGLLLLAAAIDSRTGRIPNWLTVGGMAFGLLYNASAHGFLAGLLPALGGLAAGLLLLLPLHLLRVMGAGDVKLMAMVGAVVMAPAILNAVVCTFLAGGIAALLFALYRRAVPRMTGNVMEIVQHMAFAAMAGVRPTRAAPTRASVGKLPYAMSIAAGTIGWLVARLAGLA
ncbi:MAG TPA: A24 family peptidase [Ramlibacter sp.]|jgi:prepilin peptidase CpaA|nr:A24 family peptidase [Ramlibacter sp.]